MDKFLDALGRSQRMRQRLDESEDLMARADEDYRYALLSGSPGSTIDSSRDGRDSLG
jgi:hypothetical protein